MLIPKQDSLEKLKARRNQRNHSTIRLDATDSKLRVKLPFDKSSVE